LSNFSDSINRKAPTAGYSLPDQTKTKNNTQPMGENDDLYMNNLDIVENVDGMIKMITMLYSSNSRTLKIIGDFNDCQF
jgi:hypothetical protein